jgi:hypothetical protein
MNLTNEQLNILNHVVEDGQEWADHAGEKNMLAKVEKYRQSYLDAQGDGYQTRKQKEDIILQDREEKRLNVSYSVKRHCEYPSIPDQLDYIYHNGIEKWKADMILPVKEKYPKGAE